MDEIIALLTEGIRLNLTLHRKSFESLIDRYYDLGTDDVEKVKAFNS